MRLDSLNEKWKIQPKRAARVAPTSISTHIGERIRSRRIEMGLSQERLGHALAVSAQKIQRYEAGTSRVNASNLYNLSCVLRVPIRFFFDDDSNGLYERSGVLDSNRISGVPAHSNQTDYSYFALPEAVELGRAYSRISDPSVRRRIFELINALNSENE